MKKFLLTLLAALLLVSLLCACSNGDTAENEVEESTAEEHLDDVSDETTGDDESVIEEEDLSVDLSAAQVGDIVKFGKYEQDNNSANGKEDIEWIVLDANDGKLLLLSKYALDGMAYHTSQVETMTWADCSIRAWLNDTFISEAFDDAEQAKLVLSDNDNPPNHPRGIGGCENTSDTVFLLSIEEAEKYLIGNGLSMCYPTEYAFANGAYTGYDIFDDNATCWWWLRSVGSTEFDAASVNYGGQINSDGFLCWMRTGGVRPAVRVMI